MNHQPTVPEVMDRLSGAIVQASQYFSNTDERYHQQRMLDETLRLQGEQTQYVCIFCQESMLIRGSAEQRYHFRHPVNPGAECPYRSANSLTPEQMQAIKYDGAKESQRHRHIKSMLLMSLRADPAVDQQTINEEKVVRSIKGDWARWRKPDVQARFNDLLHVFEIQLSTTFLTVIAGRRAFYQAEGALLFWIVDERCLDTDELRFTERDIFYNNNSNLFYVTTETVRSSREKQCCRLMCRWHEPVHMQGRIDYRWQTKEVGLNELTVDVANQRVYYMDVEALARAAEINKQVYLQNLAPRQPATRVVSKPAADEDPATAFARREREERAAKRNLSVSAQAEQPAGRPIRETLADQITRELHLYPLPRFNGTEFLLLWRRTAMTSDLNEAQRLVWTAYWPQMQTLCPVTEDPAPRAVFALISSLLSLQEGIIIGFKFRSFPELENLMFESYPQFYRLFVVAVKEFKRELHIPYHSPSSAVGDHLRQFKQNRKQPGYEEEYRWNALIVTLFPALEQWIE